MMIKKMRLEDDRVLDLTVMDDAEMVALASKGYRFVSMMFRALDVRELHEWLGEVLRLPQFVEGAAKEPEAEKLLLATAHAAMARLVSALTVEMLDSRSQPDSSDGLTSAQRAVQSAQLTLGMIVNRLAQVRAEEAMARRRSEEAQR
jgi:hypothetical protein